MKIYNLLRKIFIKLNVVNYLKNKQKLKNIKKSNTNQLNQFYKKVYSQNGEDGAIEKIFQDIGFESKISVEIGAHWKECNSRNLIEKYKFRGILIDASLPESINTKNKNATFIRKWITKENINQIINSEISGEVDFLSIDVDGVDLHLVNEINVINPRVICIEYCASLGKDISATVPYKPDFDRLKEHKSGFYCNASLLAYINLLKNKGYRFIGTIFGLNAFFVREDCKLQKLKELTCDEGFESHYDRTFIRGISQNDQFNEIKDLNWIMIGKDGNFKY